MDTPLVQCHWLQIDQFHQQYTIRVVIQSIQYHILSQLIVICDTFTLDEYCASVVRRVYFLVISTNSGY